MQSKSFQKEMIIEGNYPEPTPKRGPKLIYKVMFFAIGILSALTICILIRLSNNLTMEKKKEALRRFEEFTSHVIEQNNHPK
ncbi:uncharacterized protein LOC128865029 [Anastrepha ludens]|uniref:uncharacterized protein LOC128865029 n=1 Tax=Anastrepha ludens TaxID=28586 RepID=UPI0023B01E19|nr:uncharacterized protein LOC128865029 [Anastrepha ludens]